MALTARTRPARFGAFEVDLRSGELRKHGIRLKLQDQPFQVLAILLEHAGDVVTREEFREKLWSADTFVDFDTGLNSAIKKLRDVLSDSAEEPRYIETLTIQTWPLGTVDAVAIKAARNASGVDVLYVAGGSDRLLLAFDPSAHQQINSVPLSFAPTAIETLGNNSFVLRPRTSNSDPVWSFTNSTRPMVYFVPATPLPNHFEPLREVQPR